MSRYAALIAGFAASAGCNVVFGTNTSDGGDLPVHDEDVDGRADTEDNCPHLSNPAQQDADNDGVGDVCDPHPSTPGDAIIEFQPFHETVDAWELVGDWVPEGGAITIASPSPRARATSFRALPSNVSIVMTVVVLSPMTAASAIRLYSTGSDAAASAGLGCAVEGAGPSLLFVFEGTDTGPAPSYEVIVGDPNLVVHQLEGTLASCTARRIVDMAFAATNQPGTSRPPSRAGIIIENLAVRIQQVTVISSP